VWLRVRILNSLVFSFSTRARDLAVTLWPSRGSMLARNLFGQSLRRRRPRHFEFKGVLGDSGLCRACQGLRSLLDRSPDEQLVGDHTIGGRRRLFDRVSTDPFAAGTRIVVVPPREHRASTIFLQ